MKKTTVIKLCIVLGICLTFFISYQSHAIKSNRLNNMLNKTYDNAIQAGGEMLKKEFPDVINDDSDFIGYELNGIWHVQNYVRGAAAGISGYDEYERKVFEDMNSIRYVKFKDENFDEILAFGSLESNYEEMDSKFKITNFESTHFVLDQIRGYKFDEFLHSINIKTDYGKFTHKVSVKTNYGKFTCNVSVKTNYGKYLNADTHQIIDECYEINVRDGDGMIYYFGMRCG